MKPARAPTTPVHTAVLQGRPGDSSPALRPKRPVCPCTVGGGRTRAKIRYGTDPDVDTLALKKDYHDPGLESAAPNAVVAGKLAEILGLARGHGAPVLWERRAWGGRVKVSSCSEPQVQSATHNILLVGWVGGLTSGKGGGASLMAAGSFAFCAAVTGPSDSPVAISRYSTSCIQDGGVEIMPSNFSQRFQKLADENRKKSRRANNAAVSNFDESMLARPRQ